MSTKLFLDIEGTIINEFADPTYIPENVKKIKELISSGKFSEVFFFSYALHNSEDLFRNMPMLEDIFRTFNLTWDTNKIILKDTLFPLFKEKFGRLFSREDFVDFASDKTMGFQMFARDQILNKDKTGDNFLLIDDRIDEEMILLRSNGKCSTIITMHIDRVDPTIV